MIGPMLKGFTHARLACGCRITFREGVEGSPVRIPLPLPAVPLQFIHEDDVGRAFLQCIVGAGPPAGRFVARRLR